jgi:UDP-N-acetylglucosamine transferase subunit ALG13
MIFVAAGTHHQPFDRLVQAADEAAAALHEALVVQRGASRVQVRGEVHDLLPPDAFVRYLREARVVVLHGGSSSFLQARSLGRRPIIVPRRPEHDEHVDDHQVRFARSIPPDEAEVVDPEQLLGAIRRHREPPRGDTESDERSIAFCARFGPLVEGLVRR